MFLGGQIGVHRKIHTKTRIQFFCITRLKLHSIERNDRPLCDALGNKYRVCWVYFPEELRSIVAVLIRGNAEK